jgi:hypothetical protein
MKAQAAKDLEFIKRNWPGQVNEKKPDNQQSASLTKQQRAALENLYRNQ